MKSPRRPLAIALLVLAPLALAGCEKPKPGVTVWSGTDSEHVEALCWAFEDGAALQPRDCAQDVLERASSGEGITRVATTPGNTVGISVDPVVAEAGWSLLIGGQPIASGMTDTYYRFTFPETGAAEPTGYTLQVTANADGTGVRGYWFVQLVPD